MPAYLYHSLLGSIVTMKMGRDGLERNMQDFGRYEPALDRNSGMELTVSLIAGAGAAVIIAALSPYPDCTGLYSIHINHFVYCYWHSFLFLTCQWQPML